MKVVRAATLCAIGNNDLHLGDNETNTPPYATRKYRSGILARKT